MRFLMCAPDHYQVDYVINRWMEGNINKSSSDRAVEQWQKLYEVLKANSTVDLVKPQRGWPDMVFTANAGLILGQQVVLSRFLHKERQGEEPYFKEWFEQQGYKVHELPKDLPFEGAGDALMDREGSWLWAGHGFRSELDSHPYLAKWLDIEVVPLRLMDERFYHLDTCFCPLSGGYLLYYPPAFDSYSNRLIEMRVPASKRIAISEADAVTFACNCVNIESIVVMNKASDGLKQRLVRAGFKVLETPLTEFLKAGGAAKCLTLRVNEPIPQEVRGTVSAVGSRTVRLEGHLLDSGLINRALDTVIDGGGSFQVLNFQLGIQRQSTSKAEVKISTTSRRAMEDIVSQLIDLGASDLPEDEQDAKIVRVDKDGVAPDDFYVTTSALAEVRVKGRWVKIKDQRLDGTIVVGGLSSGEISASCKLLQDLKTGDEVVVDVHGIRTIRKPEARHLRSSQETGLMTSSSRIGLGFGYGYNLGASERRVETVVEQVAWELRQIRDQGGKVVFAAGADVIHTGGGEHLGRLVRDGYVQALLGDNLLAVHDLEQNMETDASSSRDMLIRSNKPVQAGPRHPLIRAVNAIWAAGGIGPAVDKGVVKSGVVFDCIRNSVPLHLTGSMLDGGLLLPDTKMDLAKAQSEYFKHLHGAQMIILLSSMAHSLSVANMTPAEVKLICVGFSPAMVTNLGDRGRAECTGVVTDVGLFLSLLIRQLQSLSSPYQVADGEQSTATGPEALST